MLLISRNENQSHVASNMKFPHICSRARFYPVLYFRFEHVLCRSYASHSVSISVALAVLLIPFIIVRDVWFGVSNAETIQVHFELGQIDFANGWFDGKKRTSSMTSCNLYKPQPCHYTVLLCRWVKSAIHSSLFLSVSLTNQKCYNFPQEFQLNVHQKSSIQCVPHKNVCVLFCAYSKWKNAYSQNNKTENNPNNNEKP